MDPYHKQRKRLVEVCPQCCKLVDSASNRLVHDTCGHSKCRICLLQETTGCLLCIAEKGSNLPTAATQAKTSASCTPVESSKPAETTARKSVITSLAIQIAEQKQQDDSKSPSLSPVDKDTCHLIKQSLKNDILFPTDIVQRSTGNFYHLKRVFSQRFFNENKNLKHKACETEEKWTGTDDDVIVNSENQEEESEKKSLLLPSHIEVQYYCTVHKVSFHQKQNIFRNHMTCSLQGEPIKKTSDSSLQCTVCNKTYKVLGKLNRHMKIHNKVTKFKCATCGKFCTDNYALRTHERTHTQDKPYTCRYCDQKFSSLHNFKRHEKKHRGEKKFECADCGFRFITKTELKRHSVSHTNIKAFACSACGTKFAFKRTLVRHMKTHDESQLRIECQHCGSTFKRKDNLERHIKNAHVEQKPDSGETAQVVGNVAGLAQQ